MHLRTLPMPSVACIVGWMARSGAGSCQIAPRGSRELRCRDLIESQNAPDNRMSTFSGKINSAKAIQTEGSDMDMVSKANASYESREMH